jgi:hypothetical protein
MPDPADAPDDATIELRLLLRPETPPRGTLVHLAEPRAFHGWIELMSAITDTLPPQPKDH